MDKHLLTGRLRSCVGFFALTLLPFAAMAEDVSFTRNGITYTLRNGAVGVTSLDASLSGKVTIPEKVTYKGKAYEVTFVGHGYLTNGSSITSIVLPHSISSFGFGYGWDSYYRENPLAFVPGLKEIIVDKDNPRYKSVDGVLYSMNMDTLYAFPSGKEIEEFAVPSSTSYVYSQAITRNKLKKVSLNHAGITLGDKALYGLTNLKELDLNACPQNKFFSSLPFGLTINLGASMTSMETLATLLEELNAPVFTLQADNETFSQEDGVLFSADGTTLLAFPGVGKTSYEIPSHVKTIGTYAFKQCTELSNLTIPSSVQTIEDYAFASCTGLKSVKMLGSSPIEDIWDTPFRDVKTQNIACIVPNQSKDAWKAATPWNTFNVITVADAAYIDIVAHINSYQGLPYYVTKTSIFPNHGLVKNESQITIEGFTNQGETLSGSVSYLLDGYSSNSSNGVGYYYLSTDPNDNAFFNITIDLGKAYTAPIIRYTDYRNSSSHYDFNVSILGSNDQKTWSSNYIPYDDLVPNKYYNNDHNHVLKLDTTTPYRYYRLEFNGSWSADNWVDYKVTELAVYDPQDIAYNSAPQSQRDYLSTCLSAAKQEYEGKGLTDQTVTNLQKAFDNLVMDSKHIYLSNVSADTYAKEMKHYNKTAIRSVFVDTIFGNLSIEQLKEGMPSNVLYFISRNNQFDFSADNVVSVDKYDGELYGSGSAANIRLDNQSPFETLYNISAKKVSYTYTPKVYADGNYGWETIVLPFSFSNSKVEASEAGEIRPVTKESNGRFWLRKYIGGKDGTLEFSSLTDDEYSYPYGNVSPYIIAIPGHSFGKYSLEGQSITFSQSNTSINATYDNIEVAPYGSDYVFHGTFDNGKAGQAGWAMDYLGSGFDAQSDVQLQPFTGYFTAVDKAKPQAVSRLRFIDSPATGIGEAVSTDASSLVVVSDNGGIILKAAVPQFVNIYNAQGQIVKCLNLKSGETRVGQLASGLYIVNNQKVIVK